MEFFIFNHKDPEGGVSGERGKVLPLSHKFFSRREPNPGVRLPSVVYAMNRAYSRTRTTRTLSKSFLEASWQ